MIQKPLVPPPVIFIGCALVMAYLPNPYPFKINALAVYSIVLVSSAIAFFSLWQFYKSKANINPIHLEKVMCLWQMVFIVLAVTQCI